MPTVTDARLELTPVEGTQSIKIDVKYNARFIGLEGNAAGLGVFYMDEVQVIGVDPPGSTTGTIIKLVGSKRIPVQAIVTPQLVPMQHTTIVSRSELNEDIGFIRPDNDEIRCLIRITARNFPRESVVSFTNEVVLSEDPGGVHP